MALPNEAFTAIGVAIGAFAKPVFDWLRGRKTASVDEMALYRTEINSLIARQKQMIESAESKVSAAEKARDEAEEFAAKTHEQLDAERLLSAAIKAERDAFERQNIDLHNKVEELMRHIGNAEQKLATLQKDLDEALAKMRSISKPPPPKE